jgi:uncharacterized membrane protein
MESVNYDYLIHWPFEMLWHWPFLAIWGLATGLVVFWRWPAGYHLALLTFVAWLLLNLVRHAIKAQWLPHGMLVAIISLFLLLLAIAMILQANNGDVELDGFELWLERYSVFLLALALFTLQTIPYRASFGNSLEIAAGGVESWLPAALLMLAAALVLMFYTWRERLMAGFDLAALVFIGLFAVGFAMLTASGLLDDKSYELATSWVFGAFFLIFAIWLMSFGQRRHMDSHLWIALAAFGVEALYIYLRIFGSLLETSLFFLIGGLLTIALAFILYRMHQRMEIDDDAGAEAKEPPAGRGKGKTAMGRRGAALAGRGGQSGEARR